MYSLFEPYIDGFTTTTGTDSGSLPLPSVFTKFTPDEVISTLGSGINLDGIKAILKTVGHFKKEGRLLTALNLPQDMMPLKIGNLFTGGLTINKLKRSIKEATTDTKALDVLRDIFGKTIKETLSHAEIARLAGIYDTMLLPKHIKNWEYGGNTISNMKYALENVMSMYFGMTENTPEDIVAAYLTAYPPKQSKNRLSELLDEIREVLRNELEDEIRDELRSELENEIREALRSELEDEIREELRGKFDDEW